MYVCLSVRPSVRTYVTYVCVYIYTEPQSHRATDRRTDGQTEREREGRERGAKREESETESASGSGSGRCVSYQEHPQIVLMSYRICWAPWAIHTIHTNISSVHTAPPGKESGCRHYRLNPAEEFCLQQASTESSSRWRNSQFSKGSIKAKGLLDTGNHLVLRTW